jgi:hypothetical protein
LPVIGHTLKSCTKQTTRYSASIRDLNFYVLDTPGFDDTAISDSTILQDLGTELAWLHRSGGKLAGLVYLHDISRPRMGRVGEKVTDPSLRSQDPLTPSQFLQYQQN